MIDPDKVTIFNRSKPELQEFLLFCVCAAGKNAKGAARGLQRFLDRKSDIQPFDKVRRFRSIPTLAKVLKKCGIGCYNNKARTFCELACSKMDLRTCSVGRLEEIYGIGPKTARFYLMHSRRNQRLACLDTHVLRWLSDQGYEEIPKTTPTGSRYRKIESLFLSIADRHQVKPEYLDLEIWKAYSRKQPYVING